MIDVYDRLSGCVEDEGSGESFGSGVDGRVVAAAVAVTFAPEFDVVEVEAVAEVCDGCVM